MLVLLSLIATALLLIEPSVLTFTTEISATLQNKCVALSPPTFENAKWISAVVCGKTPTLNSEYQLLQISGLLHLIVVSGSHLVFIEQILAFVFDRFRWSFYAKLILLTFFALVTGFQPPVVRALISQLIHQFEKSQKLFWSGRAVTLFAGITTLMMAPEWWKSLSLQLSWVAALALQIDFSGSRVKQQVAIFTLMFPLLMQFAPPHPVSIAYNLLAGPFVGGVMFPLSAAAMWFPKQLQFVDWLWSWFFKFLELTVPSGYSPDPIRLGSIYVVWFYIFTLNIFLVVRESRR